MAMDKAFLKQKLPRVLVGCPTSWHKEYCLMKYIETAKGLTYPNYDILLVDNSEDDIYSKKIKNLGIPVIKGPWFESARDRIVASRNILREKAIEGYDYLLSLEQDVIPPKDIIERLLSHKKDIVSGVYYNHAIINGSTLLVPMVFKFTEKEDELLYYSYHEIEEPNLIKVRACGLGCLLINLKVLKKINFRFDIKNKGFDDMWFSVDAYFNQFEIFADTILKCKHLIKGSIPWSQIKK